MSVRIDEGADLRAEGVILGAVVEIHVVSTLHADEKQEGESPPRSFRNRVRPAERVRGCHARNPRGAWPCARLPQVPPRQPRSEEHTSELQSLMRISYAVLCLKKKKHRHKQT